MFPNFDPLVIQSGKKKYQIAQAFGWHPTKLSAIISGSQRPSEIDQELLAQEIGCRAEGLSPKREGDAQ